MGALVRRELGGAAWQWRRRPSPAPDWTLASQVPPVLDGELCCSRGCSTPSSAHSALAGGVPFLAVTTLGSHAGLLPQHSLSAAPASVSQVGQGLRKWVQGECC